MPTNFQKREKRADQSDAARGQKVMARIVGVVQHEQRMQEKSGAQYVSFNSKPQAGWKKEWKTTMARKGDPLTGPDSTWTDEQSWLQGSKKCFDSKQTIPATNAAGYPRGAPFGTVPVVRSTGSTTAVARKPCGILPTLPNVPEQVSRTAFEKYVAEVNAALQQALSEPSGEADTPALHSYVKDLAQALRLLTKPAPVAAKAKICEAMAPVWDMRSNREPETGDALNLRALAIALDALDKSCSSKEVPQEPANVSETT
mmetsp:Transcript_59148/g.118370  ORF Transcript_59148/g.118370 Transcript_59148/m.118370 type:complete len:258 (+) Transcript_59148:84-857(+)|eukprot:CAMPEP_0113821552 /NCGR_PEP_ID=MMETSP0328-20130328/1796_1 /TAXON_ID=39455 /ORGANISM="Alexandrium minutum" /LENGTH=257 /DNA_ID=CAMNT_0000789485 /DNA_START=64 /DNA_END=837 /DNA_ORIENTATION=- /assembly_acc=CAM_ASM_000350